MKIKNKINKENKELQRNNKRRRIE